MHDYVKSKLCRRNYLKEDLASALGVSGMVTLGSISTAGIREEKKMKLVVLNGSPRKKWNTVQMLDSFVEGVKSVDADIEIQRINVYDYKFTGCRSCFACAMKKFEDQPKECRIKDEIHDLLVDVRNADGIVAGAPIYFCDISAQLKLFLERLMYPGKASKPIPSTFIYTMNAPEDLFDKLIAHSIGITEKFMEGNFGVLPDRVCAYDTYQRDHEELYKKSRHDVSYKKARRETQFPVDLQNAYEAGVRLARKMKGEENVQ